MDSSLLVWSLRIRETEALLKSRQQERAAQASRRQALQEALQQREADQVGARQRVLRAQQRLARARHGALQHRADLRALQAKADEGDRLATLRATQRSLESRRGRLEAAAEAEAQRCGAFESRVLEHERGLAEPVHRLEAALAKMEQRLSYARATYDLAALTAQLDEQRARREALKEGVRHERANSEAAAKQVEALRLQLAERERSNVEAVERSQAALREARSTLAAATQRQSEAQQRLVEVRAQRVAAAGRLGELQLASSAARTTLACLDAPPQGGPAVPG